MICDNCNGHGYNLVKNEDEKVMKIKWCEKCHGKKDIDWVENITGVTPETNNDCTFNTYVMEYDVSSNRWTKINNNKL